MNEVKRKSRSANFSQEEKLTLLNIISKHKNVIENKKTDNVTIGAKNKAWLQIEAEFNTIAPDICRRDIAALKKFYENKKKEARKLAASERQQVRGTGGGPPIKIKRDPSHELILDLINEKTVSGMENSFDSNSSYLNEVTKKHVEESEIVFEIGSFGDSDGKNKVYSEEEEINIEVYEDNSDDNTVANKQNDVQSVVAEIHPIPTIDKSDETTWQKYTPSNLKNVPSTPLSVKVTNTAQRKRKRPATVVKALCSTNIAQMYDELVEKRIKIARLAENDYHQKTKEHLKRMELLDLEIAIKKRELQKNT